MFNTKFRYNYDLKTAIKVLDEIPADNELIADDIIRTKQFINTIFAEYYDLLPLEQVKYAFMIPLRVSRFSQDYWDDVYEFLPAIKHTSLNNAFKVLSSLPPCRIEMYGKPGKSSFGVLIFVPVFLDMTRDYKNKMKLLKRVRAKINESADFAHAKFGVEYIGLGGTLPKLTNYGKTIKTNVVTTTGHAGTTWLIVQTVIKLIAKKPQLNRTDLVIGFIGGGAIGLASLKAITKLFPGYTYIIYDKRKKINAENKKIMTRRGVNVHIAESNVELISKSHLIISAITSTINITNEDLVGKVIVDDSQPGSFSREQVIKQGGELIWVVGNDKSKDEFATRRSGYSYGPKGLFHKNDVWGCEAEVAAIANSNKPEMAVQDAVSGKNLVQVGSLLKELGIVVSDYQSFGALNNE